jgi:predicted lipid-binding transport protein (Tim44 family)
MMDPGDFCLYEFPTGKVLLMSDSGSWVEIILLAMLAAFIGLRLVAVLGKRTGSERPVGESFRPGAAEITAPPARGSDPAPRVTVSLPGGTDAGLAPALQAIADADPAFDPGRFIAGARAAYGVILEAFWNANSRSMDGLVSDEIQENFAAAISERNGRRLDNRIVEFTGAAITDAAMVGQMAEVTMRFSARITSGGSENVTTDLWTFSRHIGSRDPNWLLIATDDEA